MSPETETVADVLGQDELREDCYLLREYAKGNVDAWELSYEAWTRPMKLTGGRVCLRIEFPGPLADHYYARRRDGMLVYCSEPNTLEQECSPRGLRGDIQAPNTAVTPVLREDTPFGEGGEDDG